MIMNHYFLALTDFKPAQVTVRSLKLGEFIFSPQTGTFQLNVTWEKPSFNYSKISAYALSYQVDEESLVSKSTVRNESVTQKSIHPSIHSPTYPPTRLPSHRTLPSINLSIHSSVHQSIPSVRPSVHPSIHQSIHPSIRPSILPFSYPPILPSMSVRPLPPSTYPSILLSVLFFVLSFVLSFAPSSNLYLSKSVLFLSHFNYNR